MATNIKWHKNVIIDFVIDSSILFRINFQLFSLSCSSSSFFLFSYAFTIFSKTIKTDFCCYYCLLRLFKKNVPIHSIQNSHLCILCHKRAKICLRGLMWRYWESINYNRFMFKKKWFKPKYAVEIMDEIWFFRNVISALFVCVWSMIGVAFKAYLYECVWML